MKDCFIYTEWIIIYIFAWIMYFSVPMISSYIHYIYGKRNSYKLSIYTQQWMPFIIKIQAYEFSKKNYPETKVLLLYHSVFPSCSLHPAFQFYCRFVGLSWDIYSRKIKLITGGKPETYQYCFEKSINGLRSTIKRVIWITQVE